ncbi:PIR protein [Plasmodium vivax]|uniref:VIR protein n=1 Tax=Plasmodium vivax TaxID=5855 RepID=A0A565A720_PLAVI|nr:PIR protein [Plasmodium vivax]
MLYESYVKLSSLDRLINRLNGAEYEKCHESTLGDFGSVDVAHKETLKKIGCNLESGYRYLIALKEVNLNDFCEYLNLWLDEQKSMYVKDNFGETEKQWKLIENLWNDLYRYDVSSKCRRQEDSYNISDKKKHMELLKYCIYRDHIKKRCESIIKQNSNIQRYCSALSQYTNKYYEEFKRENPCLDNSVGDNHYKYYVSKECSLYDMPKTFPKFDSQKKEILYANNSREAISKCANTTKSDGPVAEENHDRVGENPSGVVEDASGAEGKVVRPRLDDHQARSDDDRAGLAGNLAEHNELDPQLPTGHLKGQDTVIIASDGNSIQAIMPPKIGTIGATLAGSSLFLLMMYKYTPLGSWVSTRILGRNKLMENMRKNNYELLLNDVGNHEASLNDTMYHISYNSSSNQ